MKRISSAIPFIVVFALSVLAGWELMEFLFPDPPAPAKTEQVKDNHLTRISITNPKDASYLSTNDTVIPMQPAEPCEDHYRIEQELGGCDEKGCNVYTLVYRGCNELDMGHIVADAIVGDTPAPLCAEKKRQYKIAQEYIAKERKERARRDEALSTFDACEPGGAK